MPQSYDTVAADYEARFVDELDGKPRDRELLAEFAAAAGDPVVEIGCGPGQVGAFVARRGRLVIGVDLSSEMAKLARPRLTTALVADMRALPLRSARVGGVLAFYSVIHLRRGELGGALVELARVLRRDGLLLFSAHEGEGELHRDEFLDHPVPFAATLFTLDELVGATHASGLDVVRAERRPPYESEAQTHRLYVEARKR